MTLILFLKNNFKYTNLIGQSKNKKNNKKMEFI